MRSAVFIELPAFARHRATHLDDEAYRTLQSELLLHPEAGDAIKDAGGLIGEPTMTKTKRHLFAELMEGVGALADARAGKITLRTVDVKETAPADVTAGELVALRQRLNVSRAVMAARLRTNLRTLENWEQGRAKPNAQAALLIRLVEHYPETLDRLAVV